MRQSCNLKSFSIKRNRNYNLSLEITKLTRREFKLSTKMSIIIAIFSFAIGIAIFAFAYISMKQHIYIYSLNDQILSWLVSHRSPILTTLTRSITNVVGPVTFIVVTAAIVGIWWFIKREVWRPLLLIMSMAIAALTSFLLKLAIMDARPAQQNMVPTFEIDYSFPSGHTLSVIVFLLVLGYLLYSRRYSLGRFFFWIVATILGTGVIAYTRLYLGYHWLTDIVASIGLGFVIFAVVIFLDLIVTRRSNN